MLVLINLACALPLSVSLAPSPSPYQSLPAREAVAPTLRAGRDVQGADLDGDGHVDLVACSDDGGHVAWMRNDGTGQFGAPQTIARVPSRVGAIAVADFDGDGDLDVASAQQEMHRVQLHANTGTGEFTSSTLFVNPAFDPRSLAGRDVDGDGLVDLVIGFRKPSAVRWLRNLGGAAFAPLEDIDLTGGFEVRHVDAADLDGDGDLEIFITTNNQRNWVLENLGGTFGPRMPLGNSTEIREPAIQIGDIDGDGDLDVATLSHGWFRNGSGGGIDLTFVGRPYDGERTFSLEDLDGDGDLDFVTSDDGEVLWFENAPGSTPSPQLLADTGEFWLESTRFIDLGSGQADLVTASIFTHSIEIARRTSVGTFGEPEFLAVNPTGTRIAWLDVNLDGRLDAALPTLAGIQVYLGTAEEGFVRSGGVEVAGLPDLDRLGSGDFNGDGFPDIVCVELLNLGQARLMWFENLGGTGAFASPQEIASPASRTVECFPMDVDRDGDVDIVVGALVGFTAEIGFYANDGSGNFAGPTSMGSTLRPYIADAQDVNGDGRIDFALPTSNGDSSLLISQPGGGYDVQLINAPTLSFLSFLDYDHDGDLDALALAQTFTPGSSVTTLTVHENTPAGFDPSPLALTSTFGPVKNAALFDADGDGDRDLVVDGAALDPVGIGAPRLLIENLGPGAFANPVVASAIVPDDAWLSSVDVDGDGDDDLVTLDYAEGIAVYRAPAVLGSEVCAGEPNSVGAGAVLEVRGALEVAANQLGLTAGGLPPGSATLFLVSASTGFVAAPGGSQGNLCLGGSIGRFIAPGQLQTANTGGEARLLLDLARTPMPNGFVVTQPGQSWSYQAWYRDANPLPTSNFTSAVETMFL